MEEKTKAPDKSLLQRIFRTETAIFLVGVGCMIYGVVNWNVMPLFFGLCIVGGSVALHFVRKKDWDAHWAEHDRIRQDYEKRMADEKEKNKQG